MGLATVTIRVRGLGKRSRSKSDYFLVDSGSTLTVLPEAYWKELNLKPIDEVSVSLADGRVEKRRVGHAFIEYEGREAPTRVILGEIDDSKLLGAVTLEELGLVLDPLKRKLYPMQYRM